MRGEDGQAAIFAVALIAVAALAIVGLREAGTAIADAASARWAGEAAAEAAAAVIADAYTTEMRARADPSHSPRPMRDVVTAPAVRERARGVALDLSLQNGGADLDEIAVTCERGTVTVSVSAHGTAYRAGFAGSECSQP